jgi:hypothetical protein
MAQQLINIGSAGNDGTGTNWRTAWDYTNLNFTEMYSVTAINTAAIATNAQAIIDTAALITGFTKTYWFDANDSATAATPITHGAGATGTYLTNNNAGANSTSYNPDAKDALWNPSTNKFDFTSLKIGDTVEFRIDLTFTNAAAQEVDLFMSVAEGSAAPYELSINHAYYKTASSAAKDTALFRIYIGNEETRTGGARFRFASVAASSIIVNGWFYQITVV